VANTPCAIGYSGLGYNTPEVKMLRVAKNTGDTAYPPAVETTLNKTYPIARPLYMYSLGEPTGHMKQYLDWIRSNTGQKILEDVGYVPLPDSMRTAVQMAGKE
jgi:phosphate transport system substrate-binding protein